MFNLNFDFTTFADLNEALEKEALNILANEPAEIIHISDKELEQMADNILHYEDVVKPAIRKQNRQTSLLTIGAYALMIGWGMVCINMFSGFDPKPQHEQCTILPDGDCR